MLFECGDAALIAGIIAAGLLLGGGGLLLGAGRRAGVLLDQIVERAFVFPGAERLGGAEGHRARVKVRLAVGIVHALGLGLLEDDLVLDAKFLGELTDSNAFSQTELLGSWRRVAGGGRQSETHHAFRLILLPAAGCLLPARF
ncbi:MAG: hypothetical protein QM754_16600 [Tepidisphaeraceae bacterium]